jgi:biotin-dependent carboxylase-like uncharacterized protein
VSGMKVVNPGMLTLLQDSGRFGHHRIGLTNGGPLDRFAMAWSNRLVHNQADVTALEVSFGGLELESALDTLVCLAGGDMELNINGEPRESWRSHRVHPGDRISVGFATTFCRAYLAVAGGFQIEKQFDSTATVVREGIGGLDGSKLATNTMLPCQPAPNATCLLLPHTEQPLYRTAITVRVIPGYQQRNFPGLQQRRFFGSEYQVTDRADRMGYRLQGAAIECDIEGLLSEGICMGAIQIPADGQPIVLLQDRQTIGGYPKIGAALAMDCARLAQLMPGGKVVFEEISAEAAHNAFSLAHSRFHRCEPEPCNE